MNGMGSIFLAFTFMLEFHYGTSFGKQVSGVDEKFMGMLLSTSRIFPKIFPGVTEEVTP